MGLLQQITSPIERYNAAVEVRDLVIDAYEQGGKFLARLYGYVVEYKAWIHHDSEALESDRQLTRKIAKRNKDSEDRRTATRLTILHN